MHMIVSHTGGDACGGAIWVVVELLHITVITIVLVTAIMTVTITVNNNSSDANNGRR